ncbi:MAG: PLP-dependent aminotransferase family protein [Rhodospirillaceae bacterium]|nr:PLP-dependent aminotransferase family protein [Rhodospirillaceae bacterium]
MANAIGADITAGRLQPGEQLPPQRELAYQLGISVGTVTRAYAEARRRGLVDGQVGSGTYVRRFDAPETGFVLPPDAPGAMIDLSISVFASPVWDQPLREALADLATTDNAALMEYQGAAGIMRHREAGATWLRRTGYTPQPDEVMLTMGGQHAMAVAISALSRPGDTMLVENFCYPPVRALATMFGITLKGVEMDPEGITPVAFDAACRMSDTSLIYLTPTLQNPTNGIMGNDRRAEIAAIARRHDVRIIEDEVTGALLTELPLPIAHWAPERVCLISSVSKAVAPGLRTGFLAAPLPLHDSLSERIRAFSWMATPLTAEIAARWIEDGTAWRMRDAISRENTARHALVAEILDGVDEPSPAAVSPHLWHRLPERWGSSGFVEAAQALGVRIAGTQAFSVGQRGAGDHIRISVSAARNREEFRRALEILAEIGRGTPARDLNIL